MEAPSAELDRVLSDLRLASARDVDRCRGWVKQRTKGLPTFDSIWIDALIHLHKITPFQGQILEEQRGEALKVSRHLVLTERQQTDHKLAVYAAKHIETGERFLVTRVRLSPEERDQGLENLSSLISNHPPTGSQNTSQILAAFPSDEGIDVVAPYQTGEALDRLVIRRGRFPEVVVRSIAIEIATQLGAVGTHPHGDIRVANVRLKSGGQVAILNWGVLAALYSEASIHTSLPVDYLQAISPERIHSGLPASKTSDMYALGCLLWQLLAGRAPFPMVDPLARIVAHQQQQLPDVRSIAPDTSETLALLIRQMTFREPHRRLQSYRSILDELNQRSTAPRKRLKQFVRTFESAAPRRPSLTQSTWKPKLQAVGIACLLTLVAIGFMWNRTSLGLPGLMSVSATTQESIVNNPEDDVNSIKAEVVIRRSLPPVNAQGIVLLDEGGPYLASKIDFDGTLILKSGPSQLATIIIEDQPLALSAEIVRIENVQIIDARARRTGASLQLTTQEMIVRRCRFECSVDDEHSALINWQGIDQSDPRSGRLLVSDSLFVGSGSFVHSQTPISTAGFENVLKQGSGPLLHLESGVRAGLRVPLVLNHCTFRECGPLVLYSGKEITQTGRLSLQGGGSVFSPAIGHGLIEFRGMNMHAPWEQHLEIYFQGLIVPEAMPLVQREDQENQLLVELDTSQMTADGLLAGKFQFMEDGSVQIEALPVRTSSEPAGADFSRFPQEKTLR